jgi:geranylgeranyl diphosphate synthase type I
MELIHNDIIDRSNLRRGKPTLHRLRGRIVKTEDREKLGYDLGIIAGDIVYALAIDEAPQRKERALKYFIQTAAFTAMGEFIDTLHGAQKVGRVRENDVFLNYTLKTARYTFDCPLVVGAILAGAGENDIRKLSQLGVLVGQAFQIQDDIIGIFDSQKNIGKSILSDLAESKKTLLVCHAYQTLRGGARKRFMAHFNKPRKTYHDLVAIRKIFLETGSLRYSLGEIEKRVNKTLVLLEGLKMRQPCKGVIQDAVLKLCEHNAIIARQYGAHPGHACGCCK